MIKKKHADPDYAFEAVPRNARKTFGPMLFIMLGFTFFSASMSVGASLGNGMDLKGFAAAVLLGCAILAAYAGMLAFIGSDTGLSFDLLARRSFGRRGSWVPSLLIGITQIGWFGVGVAMFAIPAAEVLHVHRVVLVILAGACMTASAYFGIRGLEIVSYVSVPLIAVLGFYSVISATTAGGGLEAVFARNTQGISILAGSGLVIGSFVSGGTTTPNFTRFALTKKTAVITTVTAFFFGNTLMFIFGAVGGAFTGKDDIFYVMIAQRLMIPALIVLGANIWTTNDNALYSAGLGLSNLTKSPKKPMVLVAGAGGTIFSIWLYQNFIGWLSFLNATLPPVGVIIILDYFLNRKSYKDGNGEECDVNWGSVLGVIAGAAAGNFLSFGVSGINAMITAALCFCIFRVI